MAPEDFRWVPSIPRHHKRHRRHHPRCRSRRRPRLPYVPLPFGSISALARVGI